MLFNALQEFGNCPHFLCRGQAVVPLGVRDEPHLETVKLFCPKCQDIYVHPSHAAQRESCLAENPGNLAVLQDFNTLLNYTSVTFNLLQSPHNSLRFLAPASRSLFAFVTKELQIMSNQVLRLWSCEQCCLYPINDLTVSVPSHYCGFNGNNRC